MTDQQKDRDESKVKRPIPSKAEGERDSDEVETGDRPVPSQAEGDRDTVEEDLKRKP